MAAKRSEHEIPHQCHVFVCVNDREGARKSCADGGSVAIRAALKEKAKKRWPSGGVRVSQSLCMGLCGRGPNVVIYPQEVWFSGVTLDDVDVILDEVAKLMG